MTRQEKARKDAAKSRMRRERPHPLTHCASRLPWGSLPPQSRAARDPFGRVPEPEFRSCQTTFITPRKGERKDTDQSTRKTTQDGTRPGSWWGGPSKASGAGMLNSAMILFSPTCGSITLSRRRHSFPETTKRNGYPPR
jgi:hypothetical protein